MLDLNGAKLIGFIKTTGPYGARVVWNEGTLFVLKSIDDYAVFQDVAQPKRWGGGYKAVVGGQSLQIMRPTCRCKKDPALSALSVEQIYELATVSVE